MAAWTSYEDHVEAEEAAAARRDRLDDYAPAPVWRTGLDAMANQLTELRALPVVCPC